MTPSISGGIKFAIAADTAATATMLLMFFVPEETAPPIIGCGRVTLRLFDDGHVDRVVREDFADVAEQDVDSLFAFDFLFPIHRDRDGGVE